MKKLLCAALAAALAVSFFACSKGGRRFTATETGSFDTVTTVVAYDSGKSEFNAHFETFEKELKRYGKLFDIYTEYDGVTNLCTLNKKAAEAPVKVESDVIALLEEGVKAYEESGGRINICFGSVLSLWHEAREASNAEPEKAYIPDGATLKEAAKHCDINDLVIDKENSTVFFADSEMKLDAGAIAKGFCAEKLADFSEENGLWKDFLINLGGNVIARGYKNGDGNTLWNVQIENPDLNSDSALETLNVTNCSVVTSGDYMRYFTYEGKNYCHIIDVKTLMPAEYFSGVTVICDNSALADRLSTQLFVMPLNEGKEYVESLSGVEAIWVDKDNNITCSSGFEQYKAK